MCKKRRIEGSDNLEKFKFVVFLQICFISKYAKATRLEHKILFSVLLVLESHSVQQMLRVPVEFSRWLMVIGYPYVPSCGTGCWADIQVPLSVVIYK